MKSEKISEWGIAVKQSMESRSKKGSFWTHALFIIIKIFMFIYF